MSYAQSGRDRDRHSGLEIPDSSIDPPYESGLIIVAARKPPNSRDECARFYHRFSKQDAYEIAVLVAKCYKLARC
jgi:hypothetical protein